MMPHDSALHELASAIIDGAAIDWASVESVAADESLQRIIRDLRVIAAIAELHGSTPLPPPPDAIDTLTLAPPPTLGTWGTLHLLEKVGQGAYGEVYRAWDTRLDREVALKLLPASLADGDTRATSIIEEGRLLARVRHPNVVTIYGAERIESRIGLWMEFIRGRTLEQVLQQGRTFSVADTIHIGVELCRAVSAVHAAGLLHRDIKTHNVMLADDGRVVLMDFGSGRELGAGSGQRLAGTPVYLAPELLRDEDATVRSDIYAVGVLLYHLLTGAYPVWAQGLEDLRVAHQHSQRPELRTLRPDVPAGLARVVERAIDPETGRRHHSAEALGADLAAMTSRTGVVRLAYALGLVAALILIAIGSQVLRRSPDSSGAPSDVLGRIAGRNEAGGPNVSPVARPAIAVLPFTNLSTEPESEYFVDGLTDEIIRRLGVVDGLAVRSRTSSFAFRGKPYDLEEVGKQLDVTLAVEGSVLRAGSQLRIIVRLVQVVDDVPLWSDRFDTELENIFAIQDRISQAIVNRLQLTLGPGQRRHRTNVEAYGLFLKARELLDRRGIPNLESAADLFRQVLSADPDFAEAHAGLAHVYALMSAPLSGTLPFEPAQSIMRAAAVKARALDPTLADAHAAMGWVYSRECDWEHAEDAFQRAMDLNPILTATYTGYSISTLQPQGKLEEALRILRLAQQNDPLSLDVQREIGVVQLLAGRYEEAIDSFDRVRAADPDFPFVKLHLGRSLLFAGRLPEALPLLEGLGGHNLGRFKARRAIRTPWLAQAYVMADRRADAESLLVEHTDSPSALAVIHTALGDTSRAFDALERMAAVQPYHLGRMLLNPELAALRGDPRFAALRATLKLPAQ